MSYIELLQKYTGQKHILLTGRGNDGIKLILLTMKRILSQPLLLFPDEGSWYKVPKVAEQEGMSVNFFSTNDGIIEHVPELEGDSILYYQSPTGYYADQDIDKIQEQCKKNNIRVILDISGAIGDPKIKNKADIMVCSFGEGKIVNLGNGGFVSTNNEQFHQEMLHVIDKHPDLRFNGDIPELESHLAQVPERLHFLKEKRKEILTLLKNDLHVDILHEDRDGINIVVPFATENQKQKILKWCGSNALPYTECPRQIRTMNEAISIEVKRLQ